MNYVELALALLGGLGQILEAQQNKTAAAVGQATVDVDAIALAVLQAIAGVKGATVTWTDPASVAAFVATLQPFTPIPDPPAS
jgi:hypothetical protein